MNPFRGMASDAEAMARYTNTTAGPVVLVGHSSGSAVISQAAPAVHDVRALECLSVFTRDEGESCVGVVQPFPPSTLASTNVASPYDSPGAAGGPDVFMRIGHFHETLCTDLPEDVAAPMELSQRPLSADAFNETATAGGWRNVPNWYFVSERDPLECERCMTERMNDVTESVDGSHVAFIAHTELILKALASL
jgi:pimeloyl-ACP methyl ester carboxylesterase